MRVSPLHTALAATLTVWSLAVPTWAQDATTEGQAAPDPGAAAGGQTGAQAGDEAGRTYVREEFTDWELRCVRTESGQDPCQLYQLLEDQQGNPVAEISIFDVPDGQQVVAGATIITPLETLLTEQLVVSVDDETARRYPFSWCSTVGCFARVGFTGEEVETFRAGTVARLVIVPVAAPDQQVVLEASLAGFTAGLAAVEQNAESIAASQPAAPAEQAPEQAPQATE